MKWQGLPKLANLRGRMVELQVADSNDEGEVHTVSARVAHALVASGWAEYVDETATTLAA
jgi:hypothetical protein